MNHTVVITRAKSGDKFSRYERSGGYPGANR